MKNDGAFKIFEVILPTKLDVVLFMRSTDGAKDTRERERERERDTREREIQERDVKRDTQE